jgi:hypothetical protein
VRKTCSLNMKLVLQTDYHTVHGTYNVKIRLHLLTAYRRAHMSAVGLYYYYYYYYYLLLQLCFHSLAVILTLVTNKNKYVYIKETINKHSTNNTKHSKYKYT